MAWQGEDSSRPSLASTSQEVLEQDVASASSSRMLRVTLLADEWGSSKGGLSTINRELAKQLAKHPNVEVTFFVPKCSDADKRDAFNLGVTVIEAKERPGFEPVDWLIFPPSKLSIDIIVGHGVKLGRQAQIIRESHQCKWVQVVHVAPEELAKYRNSSGAISKGEKDNQTEIKLCEMADFVVAVGPKLADDFSAYMRSCKKEVFDLSPGILSEFSHLVQSPHEGQKCRVLVFGRGDAEDFEHKGFDIAAQAVAELKDPTYHLIFVGAPSGKEEEVKENLLKHGISQTQLTVRSFRESREKLSDLFLEADLAIMPSRTSGFGLTALEALSAGLPVLVSGNSGLGEALRKIPFGSSCIVDSEDAKVWAKQIKNVWEKDRKVRLNESQTLRTSYAEAFDWLKQCEALVKKFLNMDHGGGQDSGERECRSSSSSNVEASEQLRSGTTKTSKDTVTITIDCASVRERNPEAHSRWKRKREVMNEIAIKGLDKFDISTAVGHEGFSNYLRGAHDVYVEILKICSLKITVQCRTLEILESLWHDYQSGNLNKVAEKYLVTDEIIEKLDVLEVKLETTIPFQEYIVCKEYLMGISGESGILEYPEDIYSKPPYISTFESKSGMHEHSEDISPKPTYISKFESTGKIGRTHTDARLELIPKLESVSVRAHEDLREPLYISKYESVSGRAHKYSEVLFHEPPSISKYEKKAGWVPPQPADLIVMKAHELGNEHAIALGNVLGKSTSLKSFYLSSEKMTQPLATSVLKGVSASKSLSSCTLEIFQGISDAVAVDVGNSLRGSTTLATVTLKLFEESSDAWASVIERALTGDTPLTSVRLEIFGRMSDTAVGGLRKILSNKSLSSLSIIIHEGMTDALVAAISEGLTGEPFLKHFSLIVYGELSNSDVISLGRGFQENKTLLSLTVRIFGKVPSSWATVVDNILLERKTLQCLVMYPNVYGKIPPSQVANLPRFDLEDSSLSKLSLTLNVWGELSIDGAEALREFLTQGASSTSFTFNINGNVGDPVADSLTRNLIANKFLSSLTIDIHGVLSSSGRIALEGLSTNSQIDSFTLNVHDPMTDDLENVGGNDSPFVSSTSALLCIDGNETELEKVSLQGESSARLSIVISKDGPRDWGPRLRKCLAGCEALTTLSVTITCHSDMSGYWGRDLLSGLSECKALTTLSVTITCYRYMSGDWGRDLLSGLSGCKALTTLSVTITSHSDMSGDWGYYLLRGLSGCKALTTLSVTITCHSDMSGDWGRGLLIGLSGCKALTTLSVTIISYSDMSEGWGYGLLFGLSGCKALTTLSVTITSHSDMSGDWGRGLLSGLSGCKALTTLSVTITSHSGMSGRWGVGMFNGLSGCKALTTLSVTITSHSDMSEAWGRGLLSGLSGCKALTTLSVTITSYSDMSGARGDGLLFGLSGCKALTTLSVTITSHSDMNEDLRRSLTIGLTELCKSLATLNLTVSLYGEENTWAP